MIERINLSLKYKLLFLFLFFTVISIGFLLFSSGTISTTQLEEQSKEEFGLITNFKKKQIETFFKEKIYNVEMVALSSETKDLYKELQNLNDSLNIKNADPFNVRNDAFIKIYNRHITYFSKFISTYDFEDIYLINEENGQIIFSAKKKKDFGANIRYGKYKTSHLADVWKQTIKSGGTNLVDFEEYEPSNNEMSMFIATPLYINEDNIGNELLKAVVAVQISPKSLNHILQERPSSLKKTGEMFIMGVSNQGKTELRSDRIIYPGNIGDLKTNKHFDAALIKGESGSGEKIGDLGQIEHISFAPLNVRDLNWAIFTTIDIDEINKPIDIIWLKSFFWGLILLAFTILIGLYISNRIANPIIDIKQRLTMISMGVLPNKKYTVKIKNEIGDIQTAINNLTSAQRQYIEFANNIGNQNIDSNFKKLSDEDMLGEALLKMKESLKQAEEFTKKQQEEETKQRWMTEGIAKFGDILRQNYDGLSVLGDNIVKNLSDFLNIDQGGIFIYDDKAGKKIKLLSCFAFDRKKFMQKEISLGEGLVGACFNEKETIHLKNIPEDYPNISSGLGSAKPKEVLLIPLKIDEKVLGVIELVSFKHFKEQEIIFSEKIAESIASSIASSQINEQTKALLEESKFKSEQMSAQEEEMRQNMEELQATQEENERREAETSSIYEAFDKAVYIAYLSLEGTIIQMNENFLRALNMTDNEVMGLEYKMFNKNVQSKVFWDEIQNGDEKQLTSTIKTKTSEITLRENYHAICNSFNEPLKIINIAFATSEQ